MVCVLNNSVLKMRLGLIFIGACYLAGPIHVVSWPWLSFLPPWVYVSSLHTLACNGFVVLTLVDCDCCRPKVLWAPS